MTNLLPIEVLETHAADQRRQLHNDVAELKSTLRERLDAKKMARQYLWPAAGAVALISLLLGYGVTGIFTRD
jgi:hypothetical protein